MPPHIILKNKVFLVDWALSHTSKTHVAMILFKKSLSYLKYCSSFDDDQLEMVIIDQEQEETNINYILVIIPSRQTLPYETMSCG